MFEMDIMKNKGIDVVDSRLLHKKLKVKSYHADWIRRRIDNYGFEEGKDYFLINSKMSELKRGPKPKTYLVTLDMAKELCMLENNDLGKKTRRYFIKAEKQLRRHEAIRLATKESRRTLTDAIQESGENERMHGYGYSTYSKLAYQLSGLKSEYKQFRSDQKIVDGYDKLNFRDTLNNKQLKRLEGVEMLIKSMVDADRQYNDIKDILTPLFQDKKLNE